MDFVFKRPRLFPFRVFFAQLSKQFRARCRLRFRIRGLQIEHPTPSLFALTTNTSTATQFFGITTGTSGCRASGLVMNEKAVQYFAEVNKDDLSREMAQGGGEKLATLASLYGCQSEEARGDFAHMTQNSYERIFPRAETSPAGMLENLNREMQSHAELAQRCQAI